MFLAFRIFYTVFLMSLVTVSCFKASEKNEIQEINKNANDLLSKLIACTQNQKKCNEFDELTTQIEKTFSVGNQVPEKNEKYFKLKYAYDQFKLAQEENNLGTDAHLFKPKKPRELTQEDKKIFFEERFAKKYIGKAPEIVGDMIYYLQNYEELSKTQIQAPNQILLHGSPGTGKSYLVKTIAQELELPIIEINAGIFNDKYYGESARRIRKFFEYLDEQDEITVVFIDEIDTLAKKRSENTQGEERGALTNLLTEIQKIKDNKKIFIFCATNDFEELDPALKSRFVTAQVKELSLQERAQLFKKAFADNGKVIKDDFATKLAQVTSIRSDEFSEYSTTIKTSFSSDEFIPDTHFNALGVSIKPAFHFKRTKYHPSEFIFDNRSIVNIAISTLIKQQKCLKKKLEKECLTCQFAEEAIRQMDKEANFNNEWNKWCYNK